jgi:MSHA biogenesis protein MshN
VPPKPAPPEKAKRPEVKEPHSPAATPRQQTVVTAAPAPAPAPVVAAAAPPSLRAPAPAIPAASNAPAASEPVATPEPPVRPRGYLAPGSISKQARPVTPRERADIEYRRATAALGQGRNDEAEDALRAALNEDPTYDAARQTLVGILVEQKRVDEAKKLLQDYLAAKPNHLAFAMLLARLQIDRGDNAGAVVTVTRTLPFAGENVDFIGFAAALLQRAGRNAEAAEQYRVALRLRPEAAIWWMGLGMSLQASDHASDALDAYKHALSAGSLSPELQAFVEQRIKQVTP